MEDGVFVGVDVGKDFVDVATGVDAPRRYGNDEDGIGEVVAALNANKPQLVVMEASGGYQRRLLASLKAAGIAAVAVNPRQVRNFARAVGRLEKTDKIDAKVLRLFAERIQPAVRALPDQETQRIEQLVGRRRQLVEMLVAEKKRVSETLCN